MNTMQLTELHNSIKIVDDILDRIAKDQTMPVSVRAACVQSEGSLAHILSAAIAEAEKAA